MNFQGPRFCLRGRRERPIMVATRICTNVATRLPMPGSPSFIDLNERLRAGDEDAAARVFELYGRRLIGLARSRLHERLRGKVGPEDVLQSVLKSFFCRVAGGTF